MMMMRQAAVRAGSRFASTTARRRLAAGRGFSSAATPPTSSGTDLAARLVVWTMMGAGTLYFGTAYAATKIDDVHAFWIDNGVPGGETVLDLVRSAEARARATRLEDIQGAAAAAQQTASAALEEARRAAQQASDTVAAAAAATTETVTSAIRNASEAIEVVVEVVTGAPPSRSAAKDELKAAKDDAPKKTFAAAVSIKDTVKETVKEVVKPKETVKPKEITKSKETSPKDTLESDKIAADKIVADVLSASVEAGEAVRAQERKILVDLDAALKSLPADRPILANFAATLHDLAHTVDGLRDANAPPSTQAARLTTARDQLVALGTLLDRLKADEVALVQSALDNQASAFEHIIQTIRDEADASLALQAAEIETSFLARLADERASLAAQHDKDLGEKLLHQAEEFRSALETDLRRQAAELERFWSQEVKTRVDQEREGRLARLDHLALKLKYLERISLDAGEGFDRANYIHQLKAALRALDLCINRPLSAKFSEELRVLKALGDKDDFIRNITASLPDNVTSQYISFGDLANYLDAIKSPLRRAQLVPDRPDIFSYAFSSIVSYLILPKHGFVVGNDLESVLARADYYIAHGNMDDAAREINQLQGWPKKLARDWLAKARVHLELQQAVRVIETHLNLMSTGKV